MGDREGGPGAVQVFITSRVWTRGMTLVMVILPPGFLVAALTADGESIYQNPFLLGVFAAISPFLSFAMLRQVHLMSTAPFILRIGSDGISGHGIETRFWSNLVSFSLRWSELQDVTTHGGLGSSLTLTDNAGREHRIWATMVKGVKSDEADRIADAVEAAWPD